MVREVQQLGWTQTTANPAPITITAADPTEANVNFGNRVLATPAIDLVKTVNPTALSEGKQGRSPILRANQYRFRSGVDPDPLTIDTLVDDNGTPGDTADDFYLVQNGVELLGVTLIKTGGTQDNLLEVGETWIISPLGQYRLRMPVQRTLISRLFRQWMMKTRQLTTRMMQRLLSRILRR